MIHRHPVLRAFYRTHRITVVPMPTNASWLNLIEPHLRAMRRFTPNGSDDPTHLVRRRRQSVSHVARPTGTEHQLPSVPIPIHQVGWALAALSSYRRRIALTQIRAKPNSSRAAARKRRRAGRLADAVMPCLGTVVRSLQSLKTRPRLRRTSSGSRVARCSSVAEINRDGSPQ